MNLYSKFQHKFTDYLYYSSQLLCGFHTFLLLYWLIHVSYYLRLFYRRKRRVVEGDFSDQKIFEYRENVIRYLLFLAFLFCEFCYFFEYNLFGLFEMIWTRNKNNITIGYNCTLTEQSLLADMYDMNPGVIFLNVIRTQSNTFFLLMVWLYTVLLLHLTNAARGFLKPKLIRRWVLVGVFFTIVIFILSMVPCTSLFGVILQSIMGTGNVLVAWLVSRRFFFAMERRVNEAFHTRNIAMKNTQERLLRQYSCVIPTILIAFGVYYLSSGVFLNLHLLIESIVFNSCWLGVTFGIQYEFHLTEEVKHYLLLINFIFAVVARLITIISYLLILILNLKLIYKSVRRASKSYKYRYKCFSGLEEQKKPFLNQSNTLPILT